MKPTVAAASLLVLLAAPAATAAPRTKAECIAADTGAQTLRMSGKFRAARGQLAICSDDGCPAVVRQDCAERLDEIQRAQPTVVFEVRDEHGEDLSDVRVTMDGETLGHAAGNALEVDPGSHVFVFVAPGRAPIEKSLVVREGEKGRTERLVLPADTTVTPESAPAVAAPPAPLPPAPPSPAATVGPSLDAVEASPERGASSGQRTIGLVVGGAGVAGLVVGGVFGALTIASWNASKSACSASTVQACPDHARAVSDHDGAAMQGTVSTVAFIAGGAAVAAGAFLFFRAPRGTPSAGGVRLVPGVTRDGASAMVLGTF